MAKVHWAPGRPVAECRDRNAGLLTRNVFQVTCLRCRKTHAFRASYRHALQSIATDKPLYHGLRRNHGETD